MAITTGTDPGPAEPVWSWRYADGEGRPVDDDVAAAATVSPRFASQAEAESWVGEFWRDLLAVGVDGVLLDCGGTVVYGPMSLHPVVG